MTGNPELSVRPSDWSRQTRISSVLDFLTKCRLQRTDPAAEVQYVLVLLHIVD
jgi:hypothetical protein